MATFATIDTSTLEARCPALLPPEIRLFEDGRVVAVYRGVPSVEYCSLSEFLSFNGVSAQSLAALLNGRTPMELQLRAACGPDEP